MQRPQFYCSAECSAFPISYTEVKLSSLHFLITRRLSSLHVLITSKWNVFLQIAPRLSSSHFLIDVIHISIPCKTGKTEQYIRDAKCMVAIEASFPLSKCLQLFDKQWSAANKLRPNLELAIHVMLDRISWNCIRETRALVIKKPYFNSTYSRSWYPSVTLNLFVDKLVKH